MVEGSVEVILGYLGGEAFHESVQEPTSEQETFCGGQCLVRFWLSLYGGSGNG